MTATKEEWEAWRATEAEKNIIKADMLPWTPGARDGSRPWEPERVYFGGACKGASRHQLSAEAREIMTPFWQERQSEYWAQTIAAGEAWDKVRDRRYKDLPKYPYELIGASEMLALRLTPARKAAVDANPRSLYRRLPSEIYPLRHLFAAHRLTAREIPPSMIETAASGAVPQDGITEWELDVRPEMRGFLSCSFFFSELASYRLPRRLKSYTRINGHLARPPSLDSIPVPIGRIFERADYHFGDASISLKNPFGGL